MLLAFVATMITAIALFLLDHPTWSLGFGLGGMVSVLNFRFMVRVARRQLYNTGSTRGTSSWVVLRFLLMGLALAVGARQPSVEIFGVALGLFVVQFCIFADQFTGNRLTLGRNPGSESVS